MELEKISRRELAQKLAALSALSEKLNSKLDQVLTRLEKPVLPEFINRTELCQLFKINERTVRRWEAEGLLTPYRVQNVIRYKSDDVLELFQSIKEE